MAAACSAQTSLTGFMIWFGSSDCMMRIIRSNSTCDLQWRIASRRSWPAPCSALIAPWAAATRSWTMRLKLRRGVGQGLGRGVQRQPHVVVQIALAQMTEVDDAHRGLGRVQGSVGFLHEVRDGRDGQRNVIQGWSRAAPPGPCPGCRPARSARGTRVRPPAARATSPGNQRLDIARAHPGRGTRHGTRPELEHGDLGLSRPDFQPLAAFGCLCRLSRPPASRGR